VKIIYRVCCELQFDLSVGRRRHTFGKRVANKGALVEMAFAQLARGHNGEVAASAEGDSFINYHHRSQTCS